MFVYVSLNFKSFSTSVLNAKIYLFKVNIKRPIPWLKGYQRRLTEPFSDYDSHWMPLNSVVVPN